MEFGGMAIEKELFDFIRKILPNGSAVLELGSGFGTGELSQYYKMYSVEHDPNWINIYDSTYIHAPIKEYKNDHFPDEFGWYDIEVLKKALPIVYDLILIDGPVGYVGRGGFFNNISLFDTNVPMIFDDINRSAENNLMEKVSKYLKKPYKIFGSGEKVFGIINYNFNEGNIINSRKPNQVIKNGVGITSNKEFYVNNNFEEIKIQIKNRYDGTSSGSCYLDVNQCTKEELKSINSLFIKGEISGIKFTENCRKEFPLVDVLLFTYDRLEYTKKAIDRLLKSTNYPFNLYIVDNHSTDGTVDWLREIENEYPNIREIMYNAENRGLAAPTNDFWKRVDSDLVGKIDNDTLVPDGWLERLVDAHQKSKKLGVVGGWHFRPEDFNEKNAQNKIYSDNGIQIVEDTHIGGCCYLMKRSIYKKLGPMLFNPILKIHGWTEYQHKINREGWKVGYLYPLIQLDYMDDPRSANCLIEKKYTKYAKKIWKERNVNYSSPEQLITWMKNDAKRVTNTNHYPHKVAPIHSLKEKMDGFPLVSIIMLTWNALDYTKKCITSIQKFTHYPYEIIFVDNASTDGSVEYLRDLTKDYDNYQLIENKENKGFAGGNNQGVSVAKGKYVMLLNNDVLVSEGWLTRMVNSLEQHEKIGIVGPVTNFISGRQSYRNQYDGDDYEAFAQFIENENKGKLTPRRRLAGFAMLMKKDLFEEVNGFDETFGVGNFEDDDLSLKVRSKGLSLLVDESVFIHHYGSQTFKANHIDILENLNERLPIFQEKWPDVDYNELLEVKKPLDEYHSHLMNNGINNLERSDFSSAEKQFLQILQENPISEDALYGLVLCSRNRNDSLKACEYISELFRLNPNHSEALNQYGLIMVEQRKLSDAKKAFIAAIEVTPEFVEVQRNLAELFFLEEDYDTGVQAYITILKNHPEDIPSLLRMAELNLEADNTKEASEWAELVLKLEPEHPLANQFVSIE